MNKKIPFTRRDIAALVFLFVGGTFLAVTLLDVFFGALMSDTMLNITAYTIQVLILFLLLYVFNKKYYFNSFESLGFKKGSVVHMIAISILAYISYFVVMTVVLFSTIEYNYYLPGIGEQEAHLPLFGTSIVGALILAIIAVFIAPILEELLFRGYVLSTLNKYYSSTIAIIISAAIFAGIHIEFQVFIPLFILGILLGYLRNSTGNIYYSITFHMLNNSLAFIAELFLR